LKVRDVLAILAEIASDDNALALADVYETANRDFCLALELAYSTRVIRLR
jgi:hypothetical protein